MIEPEQSAAVEFARKFINQTNRHVFLTGRAGTGKTTFLHHLVKHTYKNVMVAAPTGIAAINANGVTLHSLFQMPFGAFVPKNVAAETIPLTVPINTPASLFKDFQMSKYKRDLLRELELLIIDEVSMVRADLLDMVDSILRHVRFGGKHLPFGGVQILFIGDLLQLPPVVKDEEVAFLKQFYPSMHFFNAWALQQSPPIYIELNKIYRQDDSVFIDLLNAIRNNSATPTQINYLNKQYNPNFEPSQEDEYIQLTTHNYKADSINAAALEKLPTKKRVYKAEIKGDYPENLYPVEQDLQLKKDAQVMFIKNDLSGEHRYFNGKIGKVAELKKDTIKVVFKDKTDTIEVEKYTWENKRYTLNKETGEIEERIVGQFIHYPIRLAWAVTIHKSQGLTFEKAIIDVSKAFAPGQVYVALSRLRTLNGLVLSTPIPYKTFETDQDIEEFSNSKPSNDVLTNQLKIAQTTFLASAIFNYFNLRNLATLLHHHVDSYDKDEERSVKQQHKPWAEEMLVRAVEWRNVSEKFVHQVNQICTTEKDNASGALLERVVAARNYFEPLLTNEQIRIETLIKQLNTKTRTKTYVTELRDIIQAITLQIQKFYKGEYLLEAMLKNKNLSHSEINAKVNEILEQRRNEMDLKRKERNKKAKKIPSRNISVILFKEGKSPGEIAEIRNCSSQKIVDHLIEALHNDEISIDEVFSNDDHDLLLQANNKTGIEDLDVLNEATKNKFSNAQLRIFAASLLKKG